ncbi:MAG: prephenate dehydrogenase/arogenate dehydrogenase family protein [Lachnospiraceae bacterium]
MSSTLTCSFIGLGLIGGSLAKALKEKCKNIKIKAYDFNKDTLLLGTSEKIIDESYDILCPQLCECDYLFLCAPVSNNIENLDKIYTFIPKNCIISDVGSTKGSIHKAIIKYQLSSQFIGAHPMAGSERSGYQNAKASLLENAFYILTPTKEVPTSFVEQYVLLVSSIDAIPLLLTEDSHDYITGAISHLPHIIAASLVNFIKDNDNEFGHMKQIAAGGFKDITRIASSNATMWQQICLSNKTHITSLLTRYIDLLKKMLAEVDSSNSESLFDFFESARVYRNSFVNASSGPIKKEYVLTIDIPDETGSIAKIATLLATNGINIKNIGITHNRECAEGALYMEFYDELSRESAKQLLINKGEQLHDKTIYKS